VHRRTPPPLQHWANGHRLARKQELHVRSRTADTATVDISFGWGYATISLRTKKIKGLHENDFIMASKLDRMFDRPDGPPDHQ
jgi:4a-hydroxytetrahydrobiopterin dehydratase